MVKSITGYSDKISVQAGETIRFMVSCEQPGPYRAELVRVVCGDLNPNGPGIKLPAVDCPINGTYEGRHQAIHNGSYVFVPATPQLAC
jgi:N,N-dimethylformamidase